MPNLHNHIELSRTFARYVIERGSRLVSDGLGREWTPTDSQNFPIEGEQGFLDEIPIQEGPLWYWANACVQLIRLIVASINSEYLLTDFSEDPTSVLEDSTGEL